MRLDGYVRVSKVNGRSGDSFISPEVQREAIERWADAQGHEIVQWHEELDRSGGRGKKRPVFEAMKARVISGESQGIVVWKLSRFGRSALDAGLAIREIEDAGGVVESATEGAQTKFIRLVYLGMAEEELDRIAESWANARRLAVDRGVYIGAAPFGYFGTVIGHKKNGDPEYGPLEEDATTGPIVREAFRVAASEGLQGAKRYLERETGRHWRPDRTRRLLRRRVYLGEVVCGKLVKAGAHEALTTPETFAAVQGHELAARPRRSSADYPLSGLASCGKCGAPLTGNLQSVRGRRYRRMRCGNDDCRGVGINADKLEAFVRDRLGVALAARAVRVRLDEGGLGDARQRLELATADRTRWLDDDRTRDLIGDVLFHQGIEQRSAAVVQAERKFAQVAGQAARAQVIPAINDLEDPEQFERAVGAMVKAVKVKPGRGTVRERVEIEWADEKSQRVETPFEENAGDQTIEAGMQALAEGQRQRQPGAVVEPNLPLSLTT